jgi:hypothetical protein
MPRDEIKRYIAGPVVTKVVLVFASRRDTKGITVQLERFMATPQPNVARSSEQFNQVEMHTRYHDDPGGRDRNRNSQRGRDSDREYTITQPPSKLYNHITELKKKILNSSDTRASCKDRDGPDRQTDRDKGCRDEERVRE